MIQNKKQEIIGVRYFEKEEYAVDFIKILSKKN